MVLTARIETISVPRWIVPIPEDDEDRPTFGRRLRELRLARGWDQDDVAAAIGVRQGKISDYELDKARDIEKLRVAELEDLFEQPRGDLAVLLWGEQIREEFRRLMARSSLFAIRNDAPPALYEAIEEIGTLEEEEVDEVRAWIRTRWKARKAVRGKKPTPIRTSMEPESEAVRLIRSLRDTDIPPERMAPVVSLYEFMRQRGNSHEDIRAALASMLDFEEREGPGAPSDTE